MSAAASILLLLEQNPFVSELEYDGFELTERERQQCALYLRYLQAAHAIARAQEAPASLDTEDRSRPYAPCYGFMCIILDMQWD